MGTQRFENVQASGHLAGQLARAMLAAMLVVSTLLVTVAGPAFAAPLAIDPSDIALTPADLPPGFAISPDITESGTIENIGSMYQIGMLREITEANLRSGPVFVLQQVVRLESDLGAGDALQLQRAYWINKGGYRPSKAGPNDGGTFSLEKTEDGVTIYLLGFIKENMIIVTGAGGVDGIVSYAAVHELATITSSRMDKALGH